MHIDTLKPRKFLSLGRYDLPHVGDLSRPYFVAVGCSVMAGSGVAYQKSWVSQVASRLGLQHVNLALEGSSLEYQYHKILESERVLKDAKFILWMQSPPIRNHRMMLRKIIGDKYARVRFHDQMYRTPDVVGRTWNKLKKFYHISNRKNIIFTNTWGWDGRLLLLLKSKIANKDKKYFVNDNQIIDRGHDGIHPGPATHNVLTDKIYGHIQTHYPELIHK
jgi:hypothetical protein